MSVKHKMFNDFNGDTHSGVLKPDYVTDTKTGSLYGAGFMCHVVFTGARTQFPLCGPNEGFCAPPCDYPPAASKAARTVS